MSEREEQRKEQAQKKAEVVGGRRGWGFHHLGFVIIYFLAVAFFLMPARVQALLHAFHDKVPEFPDLVDKAIPLFVISVILEVTLVRRQEKGKKKPEGNKDEDEQTPVHLRQEYRLNDSLNSMSLGMLQQSLHVTHFLKAMLIFPYVLVWDHLSHPQLRFSADEPRPLHLLCSYLGCFLLLELGYYWYHRCGHEVNVFWAAHVAHHSSEEYNLTTALRQGTFQ